jgi:prepilin-type N-terminal cleavage/methylation domain-containing protein
MDPLRTAARSGRRLREGSAARAFSLVELLVVIAIIGLLAAIGLPALRGFGESTGMDAAVRQVLDDVALARQQAINQRSDVYMIFVPPDLHQYPQGQRMFLTNLAGQRLTSYALYARRTVGDQPGRPTPRLLTPWRTLPDGIFFAPEWFYPQRQTNDALWQFTAMLPRTDAFTIPVYSPIERSNRMVINASLPYIRFTPKGQVLAPGRGGGPQLALNDVILRLTKGSMFGADPNVFPDIVETPKGNRRYIRISGLTGRARVEYPPGAKEVIP